MELRNINTFLKIAELHSFSKAAEAIGYSQSTVTAQIHVLEEELGVSLFDRFNKTVRLTPQGEEFVTYAQTLIRTAEDAKKSMKKEAHISGPLHIGMATSICTTFFPQILERYHARYPEVQLHVDTNSTNGLFQKLHHNEVDFVYTFDHRVFRKDQVIVLEHEEPVYFVAHPNHPLCEKPISLQELASQSLMLTESGMSYREHLDQLMAEHSIILQPILEMSQAKMLKELVIAGTGISFLPAYVIREDVLAGRLAVLDVPDCHITEWRQLIRHRDKWVTPQMEAMVEILKEMCTATVPLTAYSHNAKK